MFEQRQEQRLRLLLLSPALILVVIAGYTVLTAGNPGSAPREAMFDWMLRLAPRPVAEEPASVATILIDEDSEDRLGSWPWPRSAYARIIDAAEEAGAASITLTTSVAGDDPLSPDVLAQRWLQNVDGGSLNEVAALSVLPSNDLVLARAIAGGPVALSLSDEVPSTSQAVRWSRVSATEHDWLSIDGSQLDYIAFPSLTSRKTLSTELREARLAAVGGLPADRDGTVRRFAPIYQGPELVGAIGGAAALAAAGEPLILTPTATAISNAGNLPATFRIGSNPAITLDNRAELRLWMPQVLDVPTVPAWRVIDEPETWTNALRGAHVFIGETVSSSGIVRTGRGDLPRAQVQALIAQQLQSGLAPARPGWTRYAEAFGTLLAGGLAALSVIYLPAALSLATTLTLALLSFMTTFLVFRTTGLLFDPTPGILASLAGPFAVGATILGNMAFRDDAVRGAFHGALPQKAMRKLQAHGGTKLLQGVHREVTVLSCAFQLPPALIRQFEDNPRDYVLFKASANDRLRKTILEHDGTVDYGEDGRLLGYWNAPLDTPKHIEQACACALKMLDDVSEMSQQVTESHHVGRGGAFEELADGRIEIGISTGSCFAGPVGLGGRNRYAALGFPVSFAGRLRARSELYGPAILTDARVHEALRHHYAFLDLDHVRRDAQSDPEMIYGLVGNPFLKASKSFRTLSELQRELVASWKERDFTAATRALQKLRGVPGVPQPYVELFEERIMTARLHGARRASDQAEILGP